MGVELLLGPREIVSRPRILPYLFQHFCDAYQIEQPQNTVDQLIGQSISLLNGGLVFPVPGYNISFCASGGGVLTVFRGEASYNTREEERFAHLVYLDLRDCQVERHMIRPVLLPTESVLREFEGNRPHMRKC